VTQLYFTRSGADRIVRRKTELLERLRNVQRQKGEAAEIGGNQWHDNFSFEQLVRDEHVLNTQIAEINEKINAMVIAPEAPVDTDRLRIGHVAVLDVGGKKKRYLVGGFEDSDAAADPPVISYLAPLIRPFIGQEVGDAQRVAVGGRTKQVTLQKIFLPSGKEAGHDPGRRRY
jgi:transcription elongation GreA/GreB family factor